MQKLQDSSDYFSDKQMMYRNPLLYEQLVGQYLTDDEKIERDGVDNENLTFLSMILETVDRNEMRETKNKQMLIEDASSATEALPDAQDVEGGSCGKEKKWGDFDIPDTKPNYMPEPQKQSMINSNERNLLREEFLQEMYSSFIEGRDLDFDYNSVDNNEEYDDLQQISQDAEDKYFDSEDNDAETLEEHMQHVQEYGRKNSSDSNSDPLDVFMQHISNKLQKI
ncbi:jg27755 [Pararge aegeria aegeria]|uniref:Jg27755 protein n=2 Tax=Pararge aegeria TaxID=116150 RepID=A0A8S4RI66_9NEOP|nr:jg27755 [Pararge aegeria aegeria]